MDSIVHCNSIFRTPRRDRPSFPLPLVLINWLLVSSEISVLTLHASALLNFQHTVRNSYLLSIDPTSRVKLRWISVGGCEQDRPSQRRPRRPHEGIHRREAVALLVLRLERGTISTRGSKDIITVYNTIHWMETQQQRWTPFERALGL
jgi:hypothetical protein